MVTPRKPRNVPAACERCGQVHARAGRATCAKHKSRKGPGGVLIPCSKYPVEGLDCCATHGGGTATAKAKAAENVREEQVAALAETVRAEVEGLGRRIEVTDPKRVIMDAIAWTAGHVEFLRAQVQALQPSLLVQGPRGVQRVERTGFQAGSQTTTDVGPRVSLWWDLYSQERDRLHRYCVDAARLGLDEARIELERAQGARIAEAFVWVQRTTTLWKALTQEEADAFRVLLTMALDVLAAGGDAPFPDPATVVAGGRVVAGEVTAS